MQLLPILSSCGLENILDDEAPAMTTIDDIGIVIYNPTYEAWQGCNQFVLVLIRSSLSESILPSVIGKQISKEAWEAIWRNYSCSKSRIIKLHNRLHNIIKWLMMMNDYVKEIRTIYEELNATRQVIDRLVIVFAFLWGLPLEYMSFITELNVCLENPSLKNTITQI